MDLKDRRRGISLSFIRAQDLSPTGYQEKVYSAINRQEYNRQNVRSVLINPEQFRGLQPQKCLQFPKIIVHNHYSTPRSHHQGYISSYLYPNTSQKIIEFQTKRNSIFNSTYLDEKKQLQGQLKINQNNISKTYKVASPMSPFCKIQIQVQNYSYGKCKQPVNHNEQYKLNEHNCQLKIQNLFDQKTDRATILNQEFQNIQQMINKIDYSDKIKSNARNKNNQGNINSSRLNEIQRKIIENIKLCEENSK